jgi:hypothetical protein
MQTIPTDRSIENLAQLIGESMKAAYTMYQTDAHRSAEKKPNSKEGTRKAHGFAISAKQPSNPNGRCGRK